MERISWASRLPSAAIGAEARTRVGRTRGDSEPAEALLRRLADGARPAPRDCALRGPAEDRHELQCLMGERAEAEARADHAGDVGQAAAVERPAVRERDRENE